MSCGIRVLPVLVMLALRARAEEGDLVLGDFETEADIQAWCGHTTAETLKEAKLTEEHVSHGERAMRVVFMPATYPGIATQSGALKRAGLSDWSGREVFKLAVHTDRPMDLAIRIDDEKSTGYGSRYNDGVALARGMNYVQIPVKRIARVIDVSVVKTIILFLYKTREEYTLTFDYIAVGSFDTAAERKTMFARLDLLPVDPPYRMDVETEHVPWLRPYARGPVKVLFVTRVSSGRDAIEVAQRLSCDYDVVAIDSAGGLNRWGYGDYIKARDKDEPLYWSILKKLEERPETEVLVLCRATGWRNMPEAVQEGIIRRVNEGMGIVLINPGMSHWRADRSNARLESFALLIGATKREGGWEMGEVKDHAVTRGIPFDAWPLERCQLWDYSVREGSNAEVVVSAADGRPVVAVGTVGKGRVVQVAYDDDGFVPKVDHGRFIADEVRPYRYWETQHAFIARAIAWAAKKEPRTLVQVRVAREIQGGTTLALVVGISPEILRQGRVQFVLRGEEGQFLGRAAARPRPTEIGVELAESVHWCASAGLPEPSYGRNFLEVRFLVDGKVEEFACHSFVTPRPCSIEALEGIDKDKVYAAGSTIPITVKIAGEAARWVTAELIDGYERVASRVEAAVEGNEVKLDLPVRNHLSAVARVRVRLFSGERVADRKAVTVFTEYCPDESDDYHVSVSGDAWKYAYHERLPDIFRSFFVRTLNYGSQEAARGFTVTTHMRLEGVDPRYGDRRRGYNYERWFQQTLADYQRTGEKKYLVKDPCLSDPAYIERMQKNVRAFVRRSVKVGASSFSLGDENSLTYYSREIDFCRSEHCMKAFREWLKGEYGSLQKLNAAWKRRYASWDEVEPLTVKEAQEEKNAPPWADHRTFMETVMEHTLRRAKAAAREVLPGARVSLTGTQVSTSFTGTDWYRLDGILDEIMPYSGGSQDYLHLSFLDGPVMGCSGYGQKGKGVFHQIWRRLITGQTGGQWFFWRYELVNPDFTLCESGRDIAAILREIRGSGIGKLLKDCQRSPGGVAIHYSMSSMHAARFADAGGEFRRNWEAWTRLLEDSGFQFRFVSYAHVEEGLLTRDGYSVLVLPRSVALSPEEGRAIGAFVDGGGVVLADEMPGVMDDHCASVPEPPLAGLFRSRRGVLAGPVLPYLGERTDPAKARVWQEKAREWLAKAGVSPVLSVTVDGAPLTRAKIVRFDDGRATYWAVLKDNVSGKAVTMPDGTIEFVLTGEDPPPETIEVDFGRIGHVYEVRSGRYSGRVRTVTDELGSAGMKLYAMLPYRVLGVTLDAERSAKRGEAITVAAKVVCVGSPKAHAFVFEVRGPDGKAYHHYGRNARARRGSASHAFTTALNDPPGEWTVRVTDVVSGETAKTALVLE